MRRYRKLYVCKRRPLYVVLLCLISPQFVSGFFPCDIPRDLSFSIPEATDGLEFLYLHLLTRIAASVIAYVPCTSVPEDFAGSHTDGSLFQRSRAITVRTQGPYK